MTIRISGLWAGLLLIVAGAAFAGGMKIEPGQWEFQMTTLNPLSPTPTTETTTDCIDTAELIPSDLPAQSENCTVSDVKTESATMSWKISCTQDGGTMKGDFQLTSTGTSVTGTSVMVISYDGQSFEIKSDWQGRRTGACK